MLRAYEDVRLLSVQNRLLLLRLDFIVGWPGCYFVNLNWQ